MAYNRKNLLKRVITIQNLVLDGQKKGITQKWIYENEVYPRYFISYSTFNNFLVMKASRIIAGAINGRYYSQLRWGQLLESPKKSVQNG